MSVANLNSAQLSAAQQIYSGFYNYAQGQGADSATAKEFAQLGVGTASTEGLLKSNPWTWNPDASGQSLGPFQLYSGGLATQLGGDTSPQNQIQVAAQNMWGEPGTGGSYNTAPWNGVGQLIGQPVSGNDTIAAQNTAINTGQQYDQTYNLSGSVQSQPSSSQGGGLYYAGPGDTSQYDANSTPVTQCASAAGIGNIPAGAVTNPGLMSSLPGPVQSVLGQAAPIASAASQIIGGPWSMLGTTATTVAGSEVAAATASAGNAEASATNALSKQQAQSTQAANQTNAADTASAVNAANTDTNTALSTLKDLFTRGFFGIFGVILLAGAVVYLMRNAEPSASTA